MSRLLPLCLLLAVGCGPTTAAETRWVRWLSTQTARDAAVTPEGELVVVGRTSAHERVVGVPDDQQSSRPFIARIGAEGELLDHWTGTMGEASSVAVDDDGNRYVVLDGRPDWADWLVGDPCELRALGPSGELRWTKQWSDEHGLHCARDVAVVDDTLLVVVDRRIEGLDLDGNPRWSAEIPPPISTLIPMVPHGSGVWMADTEIDGSTGQPTRAVARRWEARDGSSTEIELDLPRWHVGPIAISRDTLFAVMYRADPLPYPVEIELAAFTKEGRLRWRRYLDTIEGVVDSTETWYDEHTRLTAAGSGVWLVSTEKRFDSLEEPISHARIRLQPFGADGEPGPVTRRSFVSTLPGADQDRPPELAAQADCEDYDSTWYGSRPILARPGADDELLLVGQQECRDSFVLALGVPR